MKVSRRLRRGKPSPPTDLVKHTYGAMVVDEMQEMTLPMFDPADADSANGVDLDPKVFGQLYDYVNTISMIYNDNPFHNL
jgi:hypothetical protein